MNWNRKIPIFFAGVLLLSMIGPFNTYESLGFWERVILWSVAFGGAGFFMHVCIVTLLNHDSLAKLPRIVRVFFGAFLGGLPATALVFFVFAVMLPPMINADNFPLIWSQVTVLGTLVGFIEFSDWSGSHREPIPSGEALAPPPALSPFLKRLPPELGNDLISVSMNDHYAEATTTRGSHMILMRFADVLKELEGTAGVRLHRSHWASCRHIAELVSSGKKTRAVLSDGRSLPVSASRADNVAQCLKASGAEDDGRGMKT